MRIWTKLLVAALCIPLLATAQEEDEADYAAVEVIYILPKSGMEQKLVESIKEHNKQFHKEGPYNASLYSVAVGEEAGWMIWVMGTFTYSELDGAPGEGAHMDHWRKTVDPNIAEYGRVEHWRYADKLSHRPDESGKMPLEVVWFLDIEPFQYHRFKEFMQNIQKVYDKQDEEVEVWTNMYSGSKGRDAGIFWPIKNWAALDDDDWKMRDVYEEENGEGSWMNAMEDWRNFVKGLDQEVWRRVL